MSVKIRSMLNVFIIMSLIALVYYVPEVGYGVLVITFLYLLINVKEPYRMIKLKINREKLKVTCPHCKVEVFVMTSDPSRLHYCYKCRYLFKVYKDKNLTYTLEEAFNTYLLLNLGVMIHIVRAGHGNCNLIVKEEEALIASYMNDLVEEGLPRNFINSRFNKLLSQEHNLTDLLKKIAVYSEHFNEHRQHVFELLIELATVRTKIAPAQRLILLDAMNAYGALEQEFFELIEQYNYRYSFSEIGRDILIVLDELLDEDDSNFKRKKEMAGRFYTKLMKSIDRSDQVREHIESAFDLYDEVKEKPNYVHLAIERLSKVFLDYNDNVSKQFYKVCCELSSSDKTNVDHHRLLSQIANQFTIKLEVS